MHNQYVKLKSNKIYDQIPDASQDKYFFWKKCKLFNY